MYRHICVKLDTILRALRSWPSIIIVDRKIHNILRDRSAASSSAPLCVTIRDAPNRGRPKTYPPHNTPEPLATKINRPKALRENRMPSTNQAKQSNNPAPLKGWVNCFYRRYKGKRLGPYYVRRWKVGRKTYKQYIKPQDYEKVRAQCEAHRKRQKERREGDKRTQNLLDNWDFLGRMLTQADKGKRVRQDQEDYIRRLHHEGMFITGRPNYRAPRSFMVPKISKRFLNCLAKTQNPYLSALMSRLRIKPEQVNIDLSPANDQEEENKQVQAIYNAYSEKLWRLCSAA